MSTQVNPYLTFNGNCAEAMNFYKDCLGADLKIQTVGESPAAGKMGVTDDKVMHAALTKGDISLFASDLLGKDQFTPGTDVSLCLNCSSEEEIRSFFAKLSVGGKVGSELQDTFWGAIFGELTDKYGKHWMFNYVRPAQQ